jgi:hypothetical protein
METIDTLEQLIAAIFDAYDQLYHDDELAALATAATINDFFYRAESERRQLSAA